MSKTSLFEAFNAKLFNINFGYTDLINIVVLLNKNSAKKFRRLQAGNRLAVLLILFYEAYLPYSKLYPVVLDEEMYKLKLNNFTRIWPKEY